jgi:trigger factor
MSVKMERVEKNVVKLQIQVSAEHFEEAVEKSYKKNGKHFNIPGFRKGKAPRNIIERQYGEGAFYEDAISFAYPKAYDLAVKEYDLTPVEYPQIDIDEIGKGKDLVFTATFTVKPEVELGPYIGIEIEKTDHTISDDAVGEELKKQQEKNARILKVEDRPAKENDICIIDFEGFIEGVPFEGGKGENYELTLGSGSFIPGFEEQLIGKEIGNETDVQVTFPEGYHNEELSGKPAVFKVTIVEIKEKKLPEVNDDFAQEVSEFETLEAYKQSIREKLQTEANKEAQTRLENNLLDKISKNATLEIPEVMVNNRIDSLYDEMERNLKNQGLTMEMYLQFMGSDKEKIREEWRERALSDVRVSLVVDKIAKTDNIAVSDEDIEQELEEMAKRYGNDVEDIKKWMTAEQRGLIGEDLVFKKTIKMLVDHAKLV